jgi:divalent metal cation (Fe/Co/Zn/Cd) transporter
MTSMKVERREADIGGTRREGLSRGLRLEFFSIAWNVLETVVGMVAGLAAGSVALVGFALDSIFEASSASVLVWRLRSEETGHASEEVERRAIRLVAVAFFALAGYVGIRAVFDLVTGARPEESAIGVVLALVSLVVMPLLAWRKRVLARELDSKALAADSRQTTLCTYLSAFLLVGLAANSLFGWWWADPVAGIAIALVAANEGRELWNTDEICC